MPNLGQVSLKEFCTKMYVTLKNMLKNYYDAKRGLRFKVKPPKKIPNKKKAR
jgi:hypothetical protein